MMFRILLVVSLAVLMVIPAVPALADRDDDDELRAVPFAFVGTAEDCAPFPAGSNIVTAAWLGGLGLPDNGGLNTQAADTSIGGTNPNKRDPHFGLLVSKNGPTNDCSSSGAEIKGLSRRLEAPLTLGYDYRNGSHCGAGAPRFNVVARVGSTDRLFFVGCFAGTKTPSPQDPLQWTQVRSSTSNPTQIFPEPIPPGSRIKSIDILFDEGTDNPIVRDDEGVGLAVLDNIFINGRVIRSGRGIEPSPDDDRGGDHD